MRDRYVTPVPGRVRAMTMAVVAGIAVALAGTLAPGAAARAAVAQPAGTRFTTAGNLLGVSAYSAHDAWAVGYAGQHRASSVLVLHWDGRAWTRLASPSAGGELLGVADVSPASAWAVGGTGSYPYHPILLHWDGRAWHAAVIPGRAGTGELTAVTATATSAWAVGVNGSGNPIVLHWTSATPTWESVSSPGAGTALDAVAASSAGSAWAAGEVATGVASYPSLIRWTTGAWRRYPFPISGNYRYVNGLAADQAGLAWAVGTDEGGLSDQFGALSMVWNGRGWTAVPVPGGAASTLDAVAAGPGHNAWAVGQEGAGPLALRWTGRGWARVRTPSPLDSPLLEAASEDATADGWAVGFGYASASSTAEQTLILHWNGATWG